MVKKHWAYKGGLTECSKDSEWLKEEGNIKVVKLSDYNKDIRKLTLKIIHLENDIKKRKSELKEEIETFRKSFIKTLSNRDKEILEEFDSEDYCNKSDELEMMKEGFKLRLSELKDNLGLNDN